MASQPLLAAVLVTLLITALRMQGTVDSDVAWQLWTAGRLSGGAQLYRDIIEVNPPLWFWMAVPVDWLAATLHLRPEPVLVVAISAFVMLALAATDRLLTGLSPARRTLLLSYAALIMMGMPWVHVGQREQIVLVGTIPYAALIAARRSGQVVAPWLALLVGTAAAFGFALNHYFLLIPLLLELWLIWGKGRASRWRRPEVIALITVGTIYAAALLIFAREFLTTVVPLVRLTYATLGAPSISALFGPFAIVGLLALLFAASGAGRLARNNSRFSSALLIAAAGFCLIYFWQAKGWIYHSIPLLGCASLALAAALAEGEPRRIQRVAGPAMLILPLLLAVEEQRQWKPGPDLVIAVEGLKPGDAVGFLTVETAVPWSVTLQHGFRYPSRYMGFWMLNAIVVDEHRPQRDPQLVRLGRQIVAETVTDFRCMPPRRIIVARPAPGQSGFDTLGFFRRDPRFVELLSHYRLRSGTTLQAYDLVSPWAAPPVSACHA